MLAPRTMSHPLPPKKEVALALLERSSVHVHLDPRAAGVVVPPWLKRQPQLVLQVGLNMPVPIPDLRLDDGGITCTLSFNRAPFYCVVPWTSVYAMVGDDGRGMVWPDDVPPEVAQPRGSQARPERASPVAAASVSAVPSSPSGPSGASGASGRSVASVARLPAKGAKTAKKTAKSAGDEVDGVAATKTKRVAKKRSTSAAAASERSASGEPAAETKRARAGAKPSGKSGGRARASEEGRGILVAVPAAKQREGAHDGARDLRDRSPSGSSEDAARPSPTPAPAHAPARPHRPNRPGHPTGSGSGARPGPKRELPPYLRVVK